MRKQNYGTVRAENVRPRQKAKVRPDGPNLMLSSGWWSLSTLSSVPYVKLLGPSGRQKEFSWNELVEVPEGESAQVFNASYHVGDIVLNGVQDFGAIPARITVPVALQDVATGAIITQTPAVPTNIVTAWRCDTRRARRAFLMLDIVANPGQPSAINFFVRGYANQRSHRTVDGVRFRR